MRAACMWPPTGGTIAGRSRDASIRVVTGRQLSVQVRRSSGYARMASHPRVGRRVRMIRLQDADALMSAGCRITRIRRSYGSGACGAAFMTNLNSSDPHNGRCKDNTAGLSQKTVLLLSRQFVSCCSTRRPLTSQWLLVVTQLPLPLLPCPVLWHLPRSLLALACPR